MVGLTLRNFDRKSPWFTWNSDFNQLLNGMDKVLVPFRHITEESAALGALCDIHENESDYVLAMDVPGLHKEDINIECAGNYITVSAERKQEESVKNLTTHRLERSFGSMKRTFSLPEGVDTNKIRANYENGVLYIAIPKAEVEKPKKIEIVSGKGDFLKAHETKIKIGQP